MKRLVPFVVLTLAVTLLPDATAQRVPGQPGREITGADGSGSSTVGVIPVNPKPDQRKVIREVAVTPLRTWKNRDGKEIEAYLLAFQPADGSELQQTGKHVILRDGKIRLMKDGKPFLLAFETLSIEDQVFVEKLLATLGPAGKEESEDAGKDDTND